MHVIVESAFVDQTVIRSVGGPGLASVWEGRIALLWFLSSASLDFVAESPKTMIGHEKGYDSC